MQKTKGTVPFVFCLANISQFNTTKQKQQKMKYPRISGGISEYIIWRVLLYELEG